MKRTIVIGDLHGCYDEAISLLAACKATAEDRIIFVGDLIDRGPKIKECVELAMKHECVLGNHEQSALYEWVRDMPREKRRGSHQRTLDALNDDEKYYNYFAKLPWFIRLPEHGAAVVHAGAVAGRRLEDQDMNTLCRLQYYDPKNPPPRGKTPRFDSEGIPLDEAAKKLTKKLRSAKGQRSLFDAEWDDVKGVEKHRDTIEAFRAGRYEAPRWDAQRGWDDRGMYGFWSKLWTGPETLIYGHTRLFDGVRHDKHAIGIDTGCVFGGKLSAVILVGKDRKDWEVVSVPAAQSWAYRPEKTEPKPAAQREWWNSKSSYEPKTKKEKPTYDFDDEKPRQRRGWGGRPVTEFLSDMDF